MEAVKNTVHVKCGFCGEDFELSREHIGVMKPGEPVFHTLGYIDQMVSIECVVRPLTQDICLRCASRGAMFAARQFHDTVHTPSETAQKPQAAKPRWSFFYWLSWAIVTITVATALLITVLLSGCTETKEITKTTTTVTLYEIDYSALSDANIPMEERQRLYQRFRKLKSLNEERRQQDIGKEADSTGHGHPDTR